MADRLNGKVAVVTGAAQGIGRTYAEALAAEGASVVVSDILDTGDCVAAIEAAGGKATGIAADVTSNSDLEKMVALAEERFGNIDILVNNAAIFAEMGVKPFMEGTEEDWDKILTVNVRGTFQTTKAVVPSMRKNGHGKIVNISSGTVLYGPPGMMPYIASKGAVWSMTKSMARELGPDNIQVNVITPGFTISDGVLSNDDFTPNREPSIQGRMIKREMVPEDLTGALIFLCTPDSDFMTGQTVNVDGGKSTW